MENYPNNFPQHPEDRPDWGQNPPPPPTDPAPVAIDDPNRSPEHPGKLSIMDSLSIAWKALSARLWTWVLFALASFLITLVVIVVLLITSFALWGAPPPNTGRSNNLSGLWFRFSPPVIVFYAALMILQIIFLGLFYGVICRDLGATEDASFTRCFNFRKSWPAILGALVAQIIALIPLLLVLIPPHDKLLIIAFPCSAIIGFFLQFTTAAAVTNQRGIGDALKSSFLVIKHNFFRFIGLGLVLTLIGFLGGLTIIGSLVTVPFAYIAYCVAYRMVVGAPLRTQYLRS